MNRAAIYARLSLADENSTSTQRQRKDCRDHAKSLGLEVVKEFVDEGISGYKDVERPAFDEAVEALVRGDFDTLIVWKLDRLTRRGMGHIGTLLDRLDGSGRRIVSKMDGIDTSQSHGRIMVALLSEMARSESVNTSIRLKAQRSEAREKGRISCGKPPWGMMTLEDGTIAPHPEKGPIARQVIDRLLAGEKRLQIVKWLNQNEHFTDRGGLWSEASLARWMSFPTLAGFVSYNPEKKYLPEPYRSKETGELVVIGEGLVTEAEYYELRKRIRTRRVKPGSYGRKSSALLSGLLFCDECGSKMYRSGIAYYCPMTRKGKCSKNTIKRETLERIIGGSAISVICAFDPGSEIHEKIEDVWRGDGSDHLPLGDTFIEEQRLDDLKRRRSALMEDRYSRGRFDGQEDLFDRLLEDITEQIEIQTDKVDQKSHRGGRRSLMDLTDAEVVTEAWEEASDEDRNSVLKTVIEKITVSKISPDLPSNRFQPDRVEIHWRAA